MRKQYGNLKRQSQNMLLKLQLVSFEEEQDGISLSAENQSPANTFLSGNQSKSPVESFPSVDEDSPDDRKALNVKIEGAGLDSIIWRRQLCDLKLVIWHKKQSRNLQTSCDFNF